MSTTAVEERMNPLPGDPSSGRGDGLLLHRLVERRARECPDAAAVVCDDRRLSYADLDGRADEVARSLRGRGLRPGETVAVAGERSEGTVIAMLGVLKAGAAYLPVDPDHPEERTAAAVRETGARLTLLPGRDDVRIVPVGHQAAPPGTPVGPSSPAYVIYTSGSTGRPKGVAVTHRNAVAMLAGCSAVGDFTPDDVWSVTHSFAFDFSVWELWGCLTTGGRAVIVPTGIARSAPLHAQLLRAHGVTVLSQTPSAWRELSGCLIESGAGPGDLALRHVVFGGEALYVADLAPWIETFGDERPALTNMYGITETTVHVTRHRVTAADLADGAPASPIGVPLPGYRVAVRGDDLRPAGEGETGELFVGGDGVALGYVARPGVTAERFVPDPERSGGRLYRSGDRVRRLPGGGLDYVGRTDRQIKVRGYRIEPGEVEAALLTRPEVGTAVVEARPLGAGGRDLRLIAYVHPAAAAAAPNALRDHLAATLPPHMIPAVFVPLDVVPRTANGKVDRAALPDPDRLRRPAERPYEEPETPAEIVLAKVWAGLLQVGRVGRLDSFFELGGDSLTAVRATAQAKREGVAHDVAAILRHQTLAAVAAACRSPDAVADDPSPGPFDLLTASERALVPPDVAAAYPLTRLQEGMLAEQAKAAVTTPYQMTATLTVTGVEADGADAVRRALAPVVERHELLRTAFSMDLFGRPAQLVRGRVTVPVRYVTLDGLPADERRRAADAELERERREPVPAGGETLWRLTVVRLDAASCRLILVHSHAILDGWSVALLMAEIRAALTGASRPAEPGLPPFRDYVRAEQRAETSPAAAAHWAGLLDRSRPPGLPSGVPAGGGDQDAPPQADVDLTRLAAGIRDLARRANAPVKSVMLAAHLAAVRRVCDRADAYTGLVTNGRLVRDGADRALGLFLNTVPFAVDSAPCSALELVERVLRAEQAMLPHQQYPLARMRGGTGASPRLEVCFNFVDFSAAGFTPGDHELQEFGFTAIPLSVHAQSDRLTIDGNPDSAGQEVCDRLAGAHLAVLDQMVSEPGGVVAAASPAGTDGIEAAESSPGHRPDYEPPAGEREELVARVWGDVLGIEPVGRRDNFFQLGGDSILAVRATARLGFELGVNVGLGVMFESDCLADAARSLEKPPES
ncbi:amino acid adenylation domain-containing protein [Actinomadura sp. 1N219]|uniref:amino acid adenylation domain-containing protein n=1 Tax=Actinomadura sp. 1N219 TaxID=3375152 RepID=UPI0037B07E15